MVSEQSIKAIRPNLRSVPGGGFMALTPKSACVHFGTLGASSDEAVAAFERAIDLALRSYREAGLTVP